MSYLIQKMDSIWQAQLEQRLKYARNLNFSTIPGSEEDFNCPKKKVSRDPMSHRIIEKRRRDRMNNCLADLSRLIPSNYLKKGRGRIEKTEIIEMAIKHLKQLQAHQCKTGNGLMNIEGRTLHQDLQSNSMEVEVESSAQDLEQYRLGYQECVSETMHFLVEIEGLYPGDSLCLKLMNHLQKHCDKLVNGEERETNGFDLKTMNSLAPKEVVNVVSPPPSRCHSEEEFPSKVLEKALRNGSVAAKKSFQVEDCIESGDRCGSQLREMLQNPSLTIQRGRSLSMGSSRPVSTTSSSSGGSLRSDEGAYKFKRTIKERFKADQQVCVVGTPSDTDGSEVDIECDTMKTIHERAANERSHTPIVSETKFSSVLNQKNRLNEYSPLKSCDTLTGSVTDSQRLVKSRPGSVLETLTMRRMASSNGNSSSPLEDIKPHHHPHHPPPLHPHIDFQSYANNNTNGIDEIRSHLSENLLQRHPPPPPLPNDIPIFALHPKGNFYVPMTVDPSILMPYMSAISDATPNILHHVGIAVYFYNGTAKIPSAQRIVLETSAAQIAQQCSQQEPCLRPPWSSIAIHD